MNVEDVRHVEELKIYFDEPDRKLTACNLDGPVRLVAIDNDGNIFPLEDFGPHIWNAAIVAFEEFLFPRDQSGVRPRKRQPPPLPHS